MTDPRLSIRGLRLVASIVLVASLSPGIGGWALTLSAILVANALPFPKRITSTSLGQVASAHSVLAVVGLFGLMTLDSGMRPIYLLAIALAVTMSAWLQRSLAFGDAVIVGDVAIIACTEFAGRTIAGSTIGVNGSLAVVGASVVMLSIVVAQFVPHASPFEHLSGRSVPLAHPARFAAPALAGAMVIALGAGSVAGALPEMTTPWNSPFQWSAGARDGSSLRGHPGLGGDRLDAGDTPFLDNEIAIRVESDEPMYWRGTTYDSYDGRYWRDLSSAKPYTMSGGGVTLNEGRTDSRAEERLVTFTLEQSGLEVFLAADQLSTLYYEPFHGTWDRNDNSIRPDEPLKAGAQWTVASSILVVSADDLRASSEDAYTPDAILEAYAFEDDISDETIALAASITGGATTRYDKVAALEDWFDANVEYTRDVADVPDGVDPVDRLLFESRVGYCEQIATAMAVMLRSQGIPTRIAVGYVPGEFDDSTGEWISRGRDAHAWTEVYFPGIGWQGFDPTSGVPLAGEEPPRPESTGDGTPGPTGESPGLAERWDELLENHPVVVGLIGGTTVVLLVLVLVAALRPRRSNRAKAQWRLDHMGRRLDLDWPESATLRDRIDDLGRYGIDAEILDRVQAAIEWSQFGPEDERAAQVRISGALDELERAIEQRLAEIVRLRE